MKLFFIFLFDTRWGQGDTDLLLFCCRCVKDFKDFKERFLALWEWMYFLSHMHSLQCCHSCEEKSFPLLSVLAYVHTKSAPSLKGKEKLHSVVVVWYDPCCVFLPSLASQKLHFFWHYNQTCQHVQSLTAAHICHWCQTASFPLDCLAVRCRIPFLPK